MEVSSHLLAMGAGQRLEVEALPEQCENLRSIAHRRGGEVVEEKPIDKGRFLLVIEAG